MTPIVVRSREAHRDDTYRGKELNSMSERRDSTSKPIRGQTFYVEVQRNES